MALQSPFFGKRENETLGTRTPVGPASAGAHSVLGSHGGSPSSQPAPLSATPMTPTTNTSNSSGPNSSTPASPLNESGSKLTVGPNIKLKGLEITDCDTLVVEGTVEATMDSRVMQIAETGSFNGSAEIDFAEIRGAFNGDLTVREKLVIFSTGRVTGKIRYGKVVIEEGGRLSGEISFGAAGGTPTANAANSASTGSTAAKAPLQAIA